MMDIAAGNDAAEPYSDNAGAAGQPAYPWRGRITCSPAAGFAGIADKTAAAAAQVAAFLGGAAPGDFAASAATRSTTPARPNGAIAASSSTCAKLAALAGRRRTPS